MSGRFVSTPEVPSEGVPEWQATLLGSIKENVELLAGIRGETDLRSRAIIRGDMTVQQIGNQTMGTVQNISPDGYLTSGNELAALTAFRALRNDVQTLANDLYFTRQALDALIRNLSED